MKNLKYILILLLGFQLVFTGCEEKNYELGELVTPSNVEVTFEVVGVDEENPYGDGSGIVNFVATADNEITFNYLFGDGKDNKVAPDGKTSHRFSRPGVNTYNVTVAAVGTGGLSASKTIQVEVYSSFSDEEALELLTGGSSKTWYWAADQPGHIGLGPNSDVEGKTFADWYNAAPYEKECMYSAEFVFTKTGDGEMTFEQTVGPSYIPGTYAGKIGVGADACYGEDVVTNMFGVKNVSFSPASSIATEAGGYRGTSITISDGGTLGWYVGKSEFEIIQVTNNILKVRIEEDSEYAWYQTLTSVKPGTEKETVDVEYSNLVWSDEFDTDGQPAASNWTYDIGTGDNGWGNGEAQFYTDRAENVTVADGVLKITTKKEEYQGRSYTSSRINTSGLFDFTYGRVDVRAKLPEGGGTWPAIWMLGSSFESAGWPACGEIDIMEAIGNNPGHIQAAIHTSSSSGATENMGSTTVEDASSAFHVYSVNWSPDQISFLVDDEIYYTYKPEVKDADTWPFDAPQFIILNVAMGGSLGGQIADSFAESTMEIDYVRVYK
ncbi:Glycosyl hydrolases family 16 [Mariniphaga anaerophila]|uniref:Glycosyl hydrolases family 16 n=1 Tax=Mariniphaga anaerophila TaxID=1484053 RepID=A0A1M4YU12_9BACT|nr:family 16 glycosylhydrolase [Mariniphaga anaerophila]SHF08846.1 Glycosyl hydrolases family 16 [Mariniphaga anaerophila]